MENSFKPNDLVVMIKKIPNFWTFFEVGDVIKIIDPNYDQCDNSLLSRGRNQDGRVQVFFNSDVILHNEITKLLYEK